MNHFVWVALALFSLPAFAAEKIIKGTVTVISDGDTIHFKPVNSADAGVGNPRGELKVRLMGIDTPELHLSVPGGVFNQGPIAQQATDYFARLVPLNSRIDLQVFGLDVHGRTLGKILVNGKDMNLEMVKSGYAYSYIICSDVDCNATFFEREHVSQYLAACQDAMDQHKGIFGRDQTNLELPFEYRLRMMNRRADKFVGDFSTRKLYKPEQYQRVPACNRVFFTAEADAIRLGFTAAN